MLIGYPFTLLPKLRTSGKVLQLGILFMLQL